MPRAKFSTAGASSVTSLVSRLPFEISDNLRSSLVFPNSTKLSPSCLACSSGASLVPVPQYDGHRIRQQQHHHNYHYRRCGGVLEDLLRTADPVVYLGWHRHVA